MYLFVTEEPDLSGQMKNVIMCIEIDIVTDILMKGLEWLGNLIRVENNRIPKVLLGAKLEAKRKVGRPELR
jgi:hypothetical protein